MNATLRMLLLASLLTACPASDPAAGSPDSGALADVGSPDSGALADVGSPDAAADSGADAGARDVAVTDSGAADVAPEDVAVDAGGDAGALEDAAAGDALAADAQAVDGDGGVGDAGPADAGMTDAGAGDAVESDVDVAASVVTPWGTITGACGSLTAALQSPDPSFHVTTWTFDSTVFDATPLAPGPAKRYVEPNAGGSSKCSEVMSMELLMACEGATFYKMETEILYAITGEITDYELIIGGDKIGVSVTRAYLGPVINDYTLADATTLLVDKKLPGINASTLNVSPEDAWARQILHIWTLNPDWVAPLQAAWEGAPDALRADTVVLVTIEQGADFVVKDTCDN